LWREDKSSRKGRYFRHDRGRMNGIDAEINSHGLPIDLSLTETE
jgi:hypothetical protein